MLTTKSNLFDGIITNTSMHKIIQCMVSPGAKLPQRAHPSDAGADLFAWFEPS